MGAPTDGLAGPEGPEPDKLSRPVGGIPSAEWTMWAASVWCEAFEGGSHKHIMSLKFLRAPNRQNAVNGAIEMLRADHPHGGDFEAIASAVPIPVDQTTGLCPVCDGRDPKCGWQRNPADCTRCSRSYRQRFTDSQIKHMVNRFLMWRLPERWHPDNGISFTPPYADEPMRSRHWPVGTNLFDYTQAEAMVRHMIEGA